MSIFDSINISGSGLTAQRLRMDLVSSNIANVDTTRATLVNGKWQPYKRKLAVLEPNGATPFSNYFNNAMGVGSGVKVTKIVDDPTPFNLVYNPSSPDANANGYVLMPNVDPLKEMTDLMSATRGYEANVTTLNASKSMLLKALEIGK